MAVDDDAASVGNAGEAARMVWDETKHLWGIGIPIAIATLSLYAVSSVTTIFVGHLGNLPLAAASIGLSIFSTFSLGFLLGMGSALETLCGQAFGAGQVAMLGVYLQRSWIVLLPAALLMVPFYVFAEPLLLLIARTPSSQVRPPHSRPTSYRAPSPSPSISPPPSSCRRRARSLWLVLAWIGVAGLCFHVALTYLLVTVLAWGSPGAAVAYDLSLWAIALGQAVYIIGWCKDGWRGWSMAAFNDMWAFVKLSLESAVMLSASRYGTSASSQSSPVISRMRRLPSTRLVSGIVYANFIMHFHRPNYRTNWLTPPSPQKMFFLWIFSMNVNGWEAMIFIGLNAAISVRVSNELGSGRPRAAMHAVIVVVSEALLIGLLCMALVLIFRDNFSVIYTRDVELQHAVSQIAGLLWLYQSLWLFRKHSHIP